MILSFSDALVKLNHSNFTYQITNIAYLTFNQWFDTYYKDYPKEYPNGDHIADNFIKVAYGLHADNIHDGFVYIDTSTNTIAGIITLNRDELAPSKSDMYMCINNVFVLPEYRGQGIAKLLVNFLMTRVKTSYSHLRQINLFCEKHLIPFYKSLGWDLLHNPPTPRLKYWYEMVWKFDKSQSLTQNTLNKK